MESQQVIHEVHASGAVVHAAFTRENWERSMRKLDVISRWTHYEDRCTDPAVELHSARRGVGHYTKVPRVRRELSFVAQGVTLPPLILVDTMNLVFRSHFAFRGFQNAEGFPTGTFYGVLKAILGLKAVSDRLVFCWDNGLPGERRLPLWRKRVLPEYKEHRTPNEETEIVFNQLPWLLHGLRILGYPSAGVPGLEADDVIGIISAQSAGDILIHSTDHDLYQLLEGQRVKVLRPGKDKKGAYQYITQSLVETEFGLPIERWAEYLALGADNSDRIRVLRGVGPKTALAMLQLGAQPRLPFSQSSSSFRKKYARYARLWEQVQRACFLAKIPRRTTENKHITKYTAGLVVHDFVGRHLPDRSTRLNEFVKFCAKFDLMEFIATRWDFFK